MNTSPDAGCIRVAFTELTELAAEGVGGRVLGCSDDFFAPAENLLKPGRGVFIADKFTARGKWMDGWESRRKRVPGHDWCVLALGLPGVVCGVDVDTNHFTGNFPAFCRLEGCEAPARATLAQLERAVWRELVPKSRLTGGSRNLFACPAGGRVTHLRLRIYPDGGVARLRVYGEVRPDWKALGGGELDLASVVNGGSVVTCNDMFFGPKDNLILPGRAKTMGGGWETRRKRVPGHDWIVVRLGRPGRLTRAEVDTNHFKGNFPDACWLEACLWRGPDGPDVFEPGCDAQRGKEPRPAWTTVLDRVKLKAHRVQRFTLGETGRVFSHVRLNIFPDGGVSRLRVHGRPANSIAPASAGTAGLRPARPAT
ncbi:MAG: allantoicase [Elusimicrobia bacterium]|nr:allantoicase [Elusimicrobiota bacterium]